MRMFIYFRTRNILPRCYQLGSFLLRADLISFKRSIHFAEQIFVAGSFLHYIIKSKVLLSQFLKQLNVDSGRYKTRPKKLFSLLLKHVARPNNRQTSITQTTATAIAQIPSCLLKFPFSFISMDRSWRFNVLGQKFSN